jgi:hypothetical protein
MDVITHLEFYQLLDAIKSLKSESDIFKDYIFPLVSIVVSTLLGWWIATVSFHKQTKMQADIEKLNSANRWLLFAMQAIEDLRVIKTEYVKAIGDETSPVNRTVLIKPLQMIRKYISGDYAELVFIYPVAKNNSEISLPWMDAHRIRTMFENFNFLLEQWELRDSMMIPLRANLEARFPEQVSFDLNEQMILERLPIVDLVAVIVQTERLIKLTDAVMKELAFFLKEFPSTVKYRVNIGELSSHAPLLGGYSIPDPALRKLYLSPTVEPNIHRLAKLLHTDVARAKQALANPYDELLYPDF